MNSRAHIKSFFEKAANDPELHPTHISLYMVLFHCWQLNNYKNPVGIVRNDAMRDSKISSVATYHKCIKALHARRYLKYEPSFNPYRGSSVVLFDLV